MKKQISTVMGIVLFSLLGFLAPTARVQAQTPPCVVPDNGSGTVTLPPAGCNYLSPQDVHDIISGLPAGTTIQLTGIHRDFVCNRGSNGTPPGVCDFVPSPNCDQPGGSLGGREECSDSTLQMQLQGTGLLQGWSRTVLLPVAFETHVGPRTPGQPVQSFSTDMYRLQGQLPPGDPDFDLLRITGGTNFGLPSPGHTTLTQIGGGNWSVDSFFDITYRIDFVGHPGGHVGGMSGSTTGTIRMATGSGACVPANCDDGNACTADACDAGQCTHIAVSCDDGLICTDDICDPATGQCAHPPANCEDGNPCTVDSCVQALVSPQCLVPDNGSGTATLPPAGCDYLSPTDVHEIISGLPAGTTIQLGAIHKNFICGGNTGTGVCSFPTIPGVDCDDPGGALGGEKECSDSTLAMVLHGTGTLAGWNRTVSIPIGFETHTAPRTPGAPTQSFDTEMFRMFGQITNPGSGDPDFDLLRIVAGNDFGLPSPGHTTLRLQPGGNWAVDSFFDITYRIDFVGRPGGHIGGMSGSTTGTIRMQTGSGVGCIHTPVTCDDGNPCTDDACNPATGQCEFTNDNTNTCSDGNACTNDVCNNGVCGCPIVSGACQGSAAQHFDSADVPKAISAAGTPTVTSTLTVASAGPYLYDLNLKTFITHTSTGQLQITLKSPAGTIVTISSQNGGTNDNLFNGTSWDDDADPGNPAPFATDTFAASNLVTDTVYTNLVPKTNLVPEEALGAFIGENPNGVWTLTIADVTNLDGGNLANWSVDVVTLPAAPTTTTTSFPSTDTPKAITDNATVTSVLAVAGAGTQIGRVRLANSILHTFGGDINLTITSPGGTSVTLTTDNGAGNDNVYNGTNWDDKVDPGNQVPYTVPLAASKMVTDTAYTNLVPKPTLTPEEALAAFNGENPNGTWTLKLQDDATGDTGTLSSWTLEITTTTCTVTACAVDCNDNNPCTDDSCNPASGCVHTPNSAACNDNNLCTSADHCSGGVCTGTATVCNDGNVCTDDACNPANGLCVFTNNTNECDDGDACTVNDVCGLTPTKALAQDFDGVTAPALPAGWISTVTPVAATNWTTSTAFAVSVPNSATTDTPTTVSDKTLASPSFIGPSGAVLEFDNRYNLEISSDTITAFDAAVLEIKIGGGGFTDVVTAGGSFVTGGYNTTVSAGFSSPLAGRAAWSGASAGFVHTKVNLPAAAAGQTVILRWRVASDASAAATAPNGQWIDNVTVGGSIASCHGTPANCDDGNACTDDSCVQGLLAPACIVTDNGGGAVTLPPAGCDYLSPSDVHEIINGLPAGTTITFAPIHKDFICGPQAGTPSNCSFVPPPGTCDQPGGTLGGNEECNNSTLSLALNGTGVLAGWNRMLSIPIEFETHLAPRVPGAPVQSFNTEMFMLQGQLPPGDPDFDLLRITAGSSFGMPSPGHTTLRRQTGTTWSVDSFFDITYRIDFVGHPGGHVGGMSGSTTATIRMQTGNGLGCVHTQTNCDDGNPCTVDSCDPVSGCVHTPLNCDDNQICTDDACDPTTGQCTHTPTNCDDGNPCTADTCIQALVAAACIVPDNGGGTVTLPPAGCDYLSPDDVHEIINGLPAGTTIEFGAIHQDFICKSQNPVCSFPPTVPTCEQAGGDLGGREECNGSSLALNLHGTGALAGWDRPLQIPINFETHVGPRTPGDPVQSFATEMFRMFGQLPPGDPDFDLLRITAGNDFGLPSPGHTTLRLQPGGNWAVDSFFDITYRIDFVGHPGGHVGGMSGSTTGTIRMQTGSGVGCVHSAISCDDGNACTVDTCDPVSGCVHTPVNCNDGNACTTDECNPKTGLCTHTDVNCDDGQICTVDACVPATGQCTHTPLNCDDGNACTADSCIQALVAPSCIVPDNGGGTVTLPPAGCDYLSPQDVHEIVAGLPAGTTIELGAIHKNFICHQPPVQDGVCSFVPPPGFCEQPGGTLGGREECSDSTLAMTLHGTGTLAGYNRTMQIPVTFETHVAPRTPGNPFQSFATDMFKLRGQLPPGDPDFDLLRITAGTGFGMPSPGHTTLRSQPGGNWAVDSFFDITYRIDFVGHPGGPLGGMSGSTTATIRMQTGSGVGCVHTAIVCNDNNPCTNDGCDPASGCFFNNNTSTCDDGNPCTAGDTCGGGACTGTPITAPPETQNVAAASNKTTFTWSAAAFATQYDVVRGAVSALPVGPGGGDEVCFDNLPGPTVNDVATPAIGTGFWYLSRGENTCGNGTYGTQGFHGAPGAARTTTTCP